MQYNNEVVTGKQEHRDATDVGKKVTVQPGGAGPIVGARAWVDNRRHYHSR
jgi:hypothetical protein